MKSSISVALLMLFCILAPEVNAGPLGISRTVKKCVQQDINAIGGLYTTYICSSIAVAIDKQSGDIYRCFYKIEITYQTWDGKTNLQTNNAICREGIKNPFPVAIDNFSENLLIAAESPIGSREVQSAEFVWLAASDGSMSVCIVYNVSVFPRDQFTDTFFGAVRCEKVTIKRL
ncbi:hypothetical protein [Xanthobacter autotrophicus]|uniref:hypothetical protein n=1 Tax=Xanthobacter autotrophicus TaxID=280 RepID=UPI0037280292